MVPQLCRKHRIDGRRARVYERWLKRATSKLRRRVLKQDTEASPRLPYGGHSD